MIVEVYKDRGYLFDKNNNEIKLVIWANLETGEVRQFEKDETGFVKHDNEGALVTTKFYDSPLRFERFESL